MSKQQWEDRYQQILSYEIKPENVDEFDRAVEWGQGAKINDDGNIIDSVESEGVEDAPIPEPESTPRTKELVDRLIHTPVPVEATEDAPKIKGDGNLFFGAFKDFYDAYWGTCEVSEPYLMAGALTQVGTMLGRRACISIGKHTSKRHVIFPNFYSAIIGATSIARKSSWLRQVRYDLRSNDRELKLMESIASAEGMIDALAKDDGGDMIETYGQTCPEGQRTLIIFDEMKALFSNSRRQITSTIIPRLTEAYNCPESLEVNTKHAPIKAMHPVVNVLAASTGEWLYDSVTQSDVSGGFINRFAYFLYEYTEPKADPEDPREEPLQRWYDTLMGLRNHGDSMRQFILSTEAWEIYNDEYNDHHKYQWDNRESFETAASAREMVHSFKIALAFAASTNEPHDDKVKPDAWLHAREVAKYISSVNAYLFKSVGAGEESKDEKIILDKLTQLGNEASKSELRQKIGGKRMSLDMFNKVLDALERAGVIAITSNRPTKVIRIEN